MSRSATLNIRDATPADRDAIREVTTAAYASYEGATSPSAWSALHRSVEAGLRNDERGVQRIVAERDGRMVGCAMLVPPPDDAMGVAESARWAELRLLAVRPDARGCGVGRALVEECAHRARDMGAHELGLHAAPRMTDAVRLIRTLGFERAPGHDFVPEGSEPMEAWQLCVGQVPPPWGV